MTTPHVSVLRARDLLAGDRIFVMVRTRDRGMPVHGWGWFTVHETAATPTGVTVTLAPREGVALRLHFAPSDPVTVHSAAPRAVDTPTDSADWSTSPVSVDTVS